MLQQSLQQCPCLEVVIVGGGLVGCKFAEEMSSLQPDARITVIGDEPLYDRTQLVKLIDGRADTDDIMLNYSVVAGRVTEIDRERRLVRYSVDDQSSSHHYDVLVIATGATPFNPPIPGIEHSIALRSLADTHRVIEMQPESAAVVGGGVLGIEIAHALNNQGCRVAIIHKAERIMERQLDADTSHHLQKVMEDEGVTFYLGAEARRIAQGSIEAGRLKIDADLVIMSTGVVPNDQLARESGLECDRGIIIDDEMRTSDPNIFAIGDCCHRSLCQVQPGYVQATIAAQTIAGFKRKSSRVIPCTKLKTHHKVFSIGRLEGEPLQYRSAHIFRKIWLEDNRIVGAIVLGEWDNLPALQDAIYRGKRLSAWQQLCFKYLGNPWPFTVQDPSHWPPTSTVCQCRDVSRGVITQAVVRGADSIQAIGQVTGAGTGCGGCRPLLAQLLALKPEPIKYYKPLGAVAVLGVLLALMLTFFSIPYPDTFVESWSFIWRDFIAKQISGYSLLLIGILLAVIAIRKRTKRFTLGQFDTWRLIHTVLGVLALIGVFAHSGGRFGDGIAFLLSLSWLLTASAGSILAAISARCHILNMCVREPVRRAVHWTHILFLWPLPLLLGYHIAGAYLWH